MTVAKPKANPKAKPKPSSAAQWLAYIESLHPKSIAMGLDRVQVVADKLALKPNFPIITVAGTNGKGSVCAMLNHVYTSAGYRVGCYTSPHLIRYNERVCVNLKAISDDDLCAAFAAVEAARGNVALTYFEMGTLAAMWHFCRQQLDIVILEVGLGGRLDAVNIFEPSCAIVTAIDLDHMEYLGDTREKIGLEKAGIFRAKTLAICGDENPPQSLLDYAENIGADLALINRDFSINKLAKGWQYVAGNSQIDLPDLGLTGDFQANNAASALQAIAHLQDSLPASPASINQGFTQVNLAGRFQKISANPHIIVDVAHNPQAAKSLAHNLQNMPCKGRTLAVFAMLNDKDVNGVVSAVKSQIDAWYVADIDAIRGAKALDLQLALNGQAVKKPVHLFANVTTALAAACIEANKNDRIVVFGSFYTVADAIADINIKL
ncbi:MAG: bifunctional tetrahydrofolate synthase/dihydrofolate synthase [Bdellovibrio sp.]|nr:bifunctional tetrahydrofolate synthase/dihydrofolate synthase [Methylotenera sp.]